MHLYLVGSFGDPLFLYNIVNLALARVSGSFSSSHIFTTIWNRASFTAGQYLIGSAGMPSGPTALWFCILATAMSNSLRVRLAFGSRYSGILADCLLLSALVALNFHLEIWTISLQFLQPIPAVCLLRRFSDSAGVVSVSLTTYLRLHTNDKQVESEWPTNNLSKLSLVSWDLVKINTL